MKIIGGAGTDLIDEDFDPDPGWTAVGDSVVVDGEVISTIVGGGRDNLRESFASQDEIWADCEFTADSLTIGTNGHRTEVFLADNGLSTVIAVSVINDSGVLKWEAIHGTDAGSVVATIDSVPFPIGVRYQLTMHSKIATTTSSDDGVCELWIDTEKILDLQGVDNNSRNAVGINVGNINALASVDGVFVHDNVKVGTTGTPPAAVGGSTKSAKDKNRRKKKEQTKALLKSIEREKRRRQEERDQQPKPVTAKPKKTIEQIPNKPPGFTPEDAEWIKRVIDKPWEDGRKYTKQFQDENEFRRYDQMQRDASTAKMNAAIAERQAFLRDEEEAIAQILTLMM